jgi:two-component system OmpR family sensor kinase
VRGLGPGAHGSSRTRGGEARNPGEGADASPRAPGEGACTPGGEAHGLSRAPAQGACTPGIDTDGEARTPDAGAGTPNGEAGTPSAGAGGPFRAPSNGARAPRRGAGSAARPPGQGAHTQGNGADEATRAPGADEAAGAPDADDSPGANDSPRADAGERARESDRAPVSSRSRRAWVTRSLTPGRMVLGRVRRAYQRLRLGTRLALGLGALALLVFGIVGTALTTYMRDYLSAQLNEQLRIGQVAQAKSIADHGTIGGKKYYRWYYAVYDVAGGTPRLRTPEDAADLPEDLTAFTELARAQITAGAELTRTARLDGAGDYRLRACEVTPGVILVSAAPMDGMQDTVRRLVTVQAVVFGAALLLLVLVGRRVLRTGLRPLSAMARTAHGIASHNLADPEARLPLRADRTGGGPEVEELRTAFNTMLQHIDDSLAVRAEAEQRLRRFVADASHELRTPLMSVRGYADLFQYAAAHAPGERDRHLARLRAEAARMSVLLDDLLLLARLDAADAEPPLRMRETDLTAVVREAADAFRAAHPDHPLTVEELPGPLMLRLDPDRIRQVLDNLLTNAAVHTPPGTAVTVSVGLEGPEGPEEPEEPEEPEGPEGSQGSECPERREAPDGARPAAGTNEGRERFPDRAPERPRDGGPPPARRPGPGSTSEPHPRTGPHDRTGSGHRPAPHALPGPRDRAYAPRRSAGGNRDEYAVPPGQRPLGKQNQPTPKVRAKTGARPPARALRAPAGERMSEQRAVVRVTDTGPGIPPADREKVFDRFYRVDKARSRDRGGSGLGLSVAGSLVAAHGGSVEVAGEPGRTVFTVSLPVER